MQAESNYHSEQQAITKGFSATVFKKAATAWCQWRHFCSWLQIAPTSKIFKTPFLSSRFSPRASVPAFYPLKGNLSRSDLSSNTSTGLVNYLHPWGAITPTTTALGSSTIGWDARWCPIRRRIILQQECGPSLSESSNPWKPPPREPPQEISQSATSPGSPSSSSSGQADTARAVPTPPSTPSVSRTSNYLLYSIPTTPQQRPTPCLLRPTFYPPVPNPEERRQGGFNWTQLHWPPPGVSSVVHASLSGIPTTPRLHQRDAYLKFQER